MHGSCLCGAIAYDINGQPRSVVACHCSQCRKSSGHYVAATQIDDWSLRIEGERSIVWYASSTTAERGFCGICGSQLFGKAVGSQKTSIMAGTIDGDTDLTMDGQIHADVKGDYYGLRDCKVMDQ